MNKEHRKELLQFLWKLLTAVLAALGGAASASAFVASGLL